MIKRFEQMEWNEDWEEEGPDKYNTGDIIYYSSTFDTSIGFFKGDVTHIGKIIKLNHHIRVEWTIIKTKQIVIGKYEEEEFDNHIKDGTFYF